MPNLNYDGTQGDHQGDHQEGIRALIRENRDVTVKEMAEQLGISPETVRRRIKRMHDVKYVGSGYSGHWEIEE